jgi:hypothetical protein
MSDSCFKKNDLPIPGTRQDERLAAALQPGYVQPDERSAAALLVFISQYAKLLRYYAVKNDTQTDYIADGDWQPLILKDEAFNYAGISITPYALPNITFFELLNSYEKGSTMEKRFAAYRVLWDVLISVYRDINAFYTALPVGMPLRTVIATEINNTLVNDMMNAAARYLNASELVADILPAGAAPAAGKFQLYISTVNKDYDYKFGFGEAILKTAFDTVWINNAVGGANWAAYMEKLALLNTELQYDTAKGFTNSFFGTAAMSSFDRIDYSTVQLKQLFSGAFESYTRIITVAADYLNQSIENNSAHQAHHGLLLAFVKLFSLLQQNMNDFTFKHLEYYYCKVLQVQPAAAVPDSVHAIFEPAKNVTSHLVAKATPLNAGKDDKGVLRLYNTNEETVISQASISQIKTWFIKPTVANANAVEKVFASPVANSMDGLGAAFTGDDVSWKAFGDERILSPGTPAVNTAALGFCIAAPVLHLTEGVRTIQLVFSTVNSGTKLAALTEIFIRQAFNIYLSGEKGWEGLTAENSNPVTFSKANEQFTIALVLKAEFPAVTGYDAAISGDGLTTQYPAVKFELNQSAAGAYENFNGIAISNIAITVTADQLTALSLQNELGTLDPAKPVQLFGPVPKIGSAFYIGHPELVHKNITLLQLSLGWQGYDGNLKTYYDYNISPLPQGQANPKNYVNITANSDFKAKVEFLRNKSWSQLSASQPILTDANAVATYNIANMAAVLLPPENFSAGILNFLPATQNGFIKFTLNSPAKAFGHSTWPSIFAQQTVAYTTDKANTLPNPPYVPVLAGVQLKYTATANVNFINQRAGHFFSIMPFGFVQRKLMQTNLLPTFTVERKNADGTFNFYPAESSLLAGINGAVINQKINILLQMDAGTENIAIDNPEIIWNYLTKNGWRHFRNNWLADSTGGLLKAGIVQFTVPLDADFNSNRLPGGLLWIAASVRSNSAGLPKALAVYTNAVKASFANEGNDPAHLATSLPAGTISKLYVPDAAVKKVNQPCASFGGKQIESGARFYTRVSERLRHKNRAVTIWDYERLVLNQFPEVYMLKCLNHTGYEIDCVRPSEKKYKENLPGSVLLVTVPFITNLQAGNIYQPTLSAGKLTDIKNYIHGNGAAMACNQYIPPRHCGLATVLVENPQYETITVTCKIKVRECLDKNFYRNQLQTDLNNFLAPWITGDAAKINFGGKLHISVVVYFIEQLHYIDYVEAASMDHKIKDANGNFTKINIANPDLAEATTSKSVLTSLGLHTITLVS